MTPTPAARDGAVDALRGLAIVLVVLGHINRGLLEGHADVWEGTLGTLNFDLYAIHMPVFFYLAGYYTWRSLAKRSRSSYLASRWSNIVYPYLFWSVVTFAAHELGSLVMPIHHLVGIADLATIAWEPINVLWFLYALLLMQLMAVAGRRHPQALLVAALIASAAWSLLALPGAAAIIGKTALHAPFFFCGFALAAAGQRSIPVIADHPLAILAAISVFATGCAVAISAGVVAPVTIFMLPLSLCGMIALAGIVSRLEWPTVARHLAQLGELSLPIYLLHSFVLAIVPRLLIHIGLDTIALELVLGTIVGVYGSWAVFAGLRLIRLDGVAGLDPARAPRFGAAR